MLVLFFEFRSGGDYVDPHQVSWTVEDFFTKDVYQTGELGIPNSKTFGPYDQLQKVPEVKEEEVSMVKIQGNLCKSNVHLRNIFWHVIRHWKKKDPQLILVPKGGWRIWSHFLHRMVHDDFKNRKNEDLRNVIDIDMMENFAEFYSNK